MSWFNFNVNDFVSSPAGKAAAGITGAGLTGVALYQQHGNQRLKKQSCRSQSRKDFLQDRDASYEIYARDQLEAGEGAKFIEIDFANHARRHGLPENKNLVLNATKNWFGDPGDVYVIKKEEPSSLLSLSTPCIALQCKPHSSSSVPPNSPLSSASLSSFGSSQGDQKRSIRFEKPIDQKAINEAIYRYRTGKPVAEDQRYIVVSNFQMPSRFEAEPVETMISLALWVILIVSLLSVVQAVVSVVNPIWQKPFYKNLKTRPNFCKNRQRQVISTQEFRDVVQDLQQKAVETCVAYKNGKISRNECRQEMIEQCLMMPDIAEMVLYYVDSGTPLPDFVEAIFKNGLAANRVDNSPSVRRPLSSDTFSRIPPPPPPPPPSAFAKQKLARKSFLSRIKSVVSHTQIGFLETQLLIVCLIVVFVLLYNLKLNHGF